MIKIKFQKSVYEAFGISYNAVRKMAEKLNYGIMNFSLTYLGLPIGFNQMRGINLKTCFEQI